MGKPVVKGPVDGNAYAILGVTSRAMRRAGETPERIKEMTDRATSGDYDHLLGVVQEYVDFDLGSESNEEKDDPYEENDDDEKS